MFKVSATPSFVHDAVITVPIDGGFENQTIRATYAVLSDEDFDAFDLRSNDGMKDFLRRAVRRMEDLVDEDKTPLTYSDALRDQLLELPYVRLGLFRGYQSAMIGAKSGN